MWPWRPWSSSEARPGGWRASPAPWWRRSGTTSPPRGPSGEPLANGEPAVVPQKPAAAGPGADRRAPCGGRRHPPDRGRGLLPALGATSAARLSRPPADDRLVDPRGRDVVRRHPAGGPGRRRAGERGLELADRRTGARAGRRWPDRLPRGALVQRHPHRGPGRDAGDPGRAGQPVLVGDALDARPVLADAARGLVAGGRPRRGPGGDVEILGPVPGAGRAALAR